ncbi:hypothetical protein [Leptospira interrogans]|uniref:hypothetical protein n=1 Tax=Leptospira interrogans TaxID=173 RepID=UPI0002983096|nr:hypothetical protein [Leptospira interrogans]EKR16125.1 putative lipoprotein [Leptospira interrogans serovar Pyrogenes str. 2006006960]
MTDQKNYISILLIVLSLSLASCKEKQEETKVEITDKYALPPNYTGSLNAVPYDFEYKSPQWIGISASIEKFLGIQKTLYSGHCALLDLEKKTFSIRITGTKKDRVLRFLYLGNHRFALLNQENRGYIGKLKEGFSGSNERVNYYSFYPLSEIMNEKKIDYTGPAPNERELTFSEIDGSKYKSMNDCEQETIEQEKVQQSIDEEHERVKGDLAPP